MSERLLAFYDVNDDLNTNSLKALIPPLNAGTPFVESMTSYLSRLAKYCDVRFTQLVKTVASYKNGFAEPVEGETETWIHSCNGISPLAEDLSLCLQMLTLRNGFENLSMARWKKIIRPDKDGMFKKHKEWCPYCFHEWEKKGIPMYEPLIWNLKNVEICLLHKTPLTQVCPLCEKHQTYAYHKRGIGYCTSCGCRISAMPPSGLTAYPTSYKELIGDKNNWFENSIGELLSLPSSITHRLNSTSIASFLNRKAELYTSGDVAKFALLLGLEEKELVPWASGSSHPQFDQLIDFTYRLNIFPSEMIIDKNSPMEPKRTVRNELSVKEVEANIQEYDESEIKRLLEFFIALRHPWPIELIAKVLKCSAGYLRFAFPVQVRRLEEKLTMEKDSTGQTRNCGAEYAKAIRLVLHQKQFQICERNSVVPSQINNSHDKNGARKEAKMRRHVMVELAYYDGYKALKGKNISPSEFLSPTKDLGGKISGKADLKSNETTMYRQFGREVVTIRRIKESREQILSLPKGLRGLKADEDDWSHIEAMIRKYHEEEMAQVRALEEIRLAKIKEDNWRYQQRWDSLQKYRTYNKW